MAKSNSFGRSNLAPGILASYLILATGFGGCLMVLLIAGQATPIHVGGLAAAFGLIGLVPILLTRIATAGWELPRRCRRRTWWKWITGGYRRKDPSIALKPWPKKPRPPGSVPAPHGTDYVSTFRPAPQREDG